MKKNKKLEIIEGKVELLWDELDKLTKVVKMMSDKLKELDEKRNYNFF